MSAKAILKVAERQNVQRELFADPQQDYSKAVDFYQHDVDWANRLILGDSLTVMNSLVHREDLAGKVQMIYIDPPYGIKYASNFQPTVFQRDVKDRAQDLTREQEQIRAYRDIWTLGVHSYLAYLRDRLIVAKDLLTDSGSVFVQISDENVHRVRCIVDEVFGSENFINQLIFTKTRSLVASDFVTTICDYILWYAKDKDAAKEKVQKVFLKRQDNSLASHFENSDGEVLTIGERNLKEQDGKPIDAYKPFMSDNLIRRPNPEIKFDWQGRKIQGRFRTNEQGLKRALQANRILFTRSGIRYKFFLDDFPVSPLNHLWDDVIGAQNPIYAVQTNTQVVERCMLMTTNPGDIVLDPTCGSGTTTYVAEQWGRCWITIDTSRVAIALARQRLLTASLQEALTDYRKAWRAKMDEVNACIAASSEDEVLVDQPEIDRKRVRVSGPFTVEAVQPAEESLDVDSPIDGEPEDIPDTFDSETDGDNAANAEAYLDKMIRLLRNDGVRFPDNQTLKFAALDPLEGDVLHAEGSWEDDETERRVAVVFGPQHGPVTAMQVEQCLRAAYRFAYDDLVFAGFSFDGAAQAIIQDDPNPRVRIHIAHINPDVAMGDLLKETPSSQLFTVFGLPRTELEGTENGEYIVKMEGVDTYNPVDNTVRSAGADKVAAWFIDTDYDGRTFCITQAFFPDKSAWNKIARALKGVIDEDRFEQFSGTESFPFPAGEHACVAVKVIDPRGNEVMSVHNLGDRRY